MLARGLHTVKPSGGSGPWEPPTPEELAQLLPQYRIESLLGRGGMGAVYKGAQAALDRPVAIKLLPAELAGDGDFLARFQREARTLARLQHSGIVTVHDFGQTSEGHLYFVMEFVDGTDLQQILKGPGLEPEQAFELIAQICDALHYAHRQGVIHRDIKPANILLTKDGRAKVADFGLARPLIEEAGGLTQTNVVMGTPDYMAPEQRTSATHADHRADIFALGVMLYEMLTGQRPHGAFQPPSHRVQVDVRIDEVVLKALQQEPDRRYQQASEMKVDVDRIRTTPPEKVKKKTGSRVLLAVAAAAAVVVVLATLAAPRVRSLFSGKSTPTDAVAQAWTPVALSSDPQMPADAEGWVSPFRWELNKLLGKDNFTDGAVRVRYRWTEGAILMLDLRRYDRAGVQVKLSRDQVQLQEWENATNSNRGEIAITPLKPGDEGILELAVVGDRAFARLNGKLLVIEKISADKKGQTLVSNGYGEKMARVRDVAYLNLDGIDDPLQALGWATAEPVLSDRSLWKKATWSDGDRPRISADGWLTVGDALLTAEPHRVPGQGLKFADGAVRAQIRFTTPRSSLMSFWVRMPNKQSVHFAISDSEFIASRTDKGEVGRVAFDTPFRAGEIEHFEAAAVGDTFIARFKGKGLRVQAPEANRSGGILFHGRNYVVKDVEYAILDGLPDPLKALGWEAAAPSRPSSVELRVPIPEWLQKARQEGGRLVFERAADIPAEFNALFDLGAAAQFDDFVELFNTTYAWAALRRNGELWGKTWDAHYKKVSSFGPIQVRSIVRGYSLPVVDAAGSILMFPGSLTIGPGTAGLTRAVGIHAREGRTEVLLDEAGRSLLTRNANSMKTPPPDGFFQNATILSATTGCFLAAEPGKPLRLWDFNTGRPVVPSEKLDDIVEVSPRAGDFIVLRSTGEAVVLSEKTGQVNASSLSAPTNLGPAIRVRSQGSFLAQRADGGWVSWRDGADKRPDETLPLLAKIGPAIDVLAAMIALPGQGVKGSYVMAIQPRNGPAETPSAQSTAKAKKRLVEARAHLKAGDAAEARELVGQALAAAPGALDVQAEAALLFADAQAPERAVQLAQDFVTKADAEHPQFAAITELSVKLAPTLKRYEQHLRTAAELVGKSDDASEIRELKAALVLVPDGRQAAEKLAANPLHLGKPVPGRKFTHELGHTFVPVEGLANVLFSTWETRVKDFEQFVKETGHDMSEPRLGENKALTWQKPGFEQTGDHPVVLVTRDDAEFFCRWLTDKERKAGRLLSGQVYRLPTDREWSAAMGVLDEPGDFPADRQFPKDVFTWPKGTPPARNAENFSWQNDDFPNTAPVGSGKPNRFGLYDLMGNVGELCADPFHFSFPIVTVRGSSFRAGIGANRHASGDTQGGKFWGRSEHGFRCVLDLKTEEQRRTQIAFEQAWQKFCDADSSPGARPEGAHRKRARAVINDEMTLLDLSRTNWSSEHTLDFFAAVPVTHLYASGGNMKGAMQVTKKWPLRSVSLHTLIQAEENFLESFRGLPLEWAYLALHQDGPMAVKSLDAFTGMKLKALYLDNFKHLQTFEPLRRMPLEKFILNGATATLDLAPLKEAPLRHIFVPRFTSLEQFLDSCDWWGAKLVQVESDGAAAFSRFFREAAMSGRPAKVQEVKEALSRKLAGLAAFQGWLQTLNGDRMKPVIESSKAVARFVAGDTTALNGQFQVFAGHSYLSWPEGLTLEEARDFAPKLGGHMITITSKEENDFIVQQMEKGGIMKDCRLGLERVGPGRMGWKWVTGEPLAYHNWGPESGALGDAAVFVHDKESGSGITMAKKTFAPSSSNGTRPRRSRHFRPHFIPSHDSSHPRTPR